MPQLMLDGSKVGEGHRTYVIAEAGINHNGSVPIAKKLIDAAADAGADAVKFQMRDLTATYTGNTVKNPAEAEHGITYTVSNLADVLLTEEDFREIAAYAEDGGMTFLASPWDPNSVGHVERLGAPFYKVGSPDMTNIPLLEQIVATGKPLIVSTGMAERREVDRTVAFLKEQDADFALLHCTSTYPAPISDINLAFMDTMREQYDVPVGYSGHERGRAVTLAAVARGADIVERHITVDRTMDGPDHAASLEPDELTGLVQDIRDVEKSIGTPEKRMTRGEARNRVALGKSLVATRRIAKGDTITRENLAAKSPAKGISPQELPRVVGATAKQDIAEDEYIRWQDVAVASEKPVEPSLKNWGAIVRYSDIDSSNWGAPSLYEFRLDGSDIAEPFDLAGSYQTDVSVHAPEVRQHRVVDLSAQDEARREAAVAVVNKVLDRVRNDVSPHFPTDEPYVIVHPGGVTMDEMRLEQTSALNASLERSLNELDDSGVRILVENMPPNPWIFGGQRFHNNFMRAEEIAAFCERTGHRICYDISHAKLWCTYADENLQTHFETVQPYISYLHVADAAGVNDEGLQIGRGDIDFEAVAPLIRKLDVPIVTEIWRGHERNGHGFKIAAERLETILEAA